MTKLVKLGHILAQSEDQEPELFISDQRKRGHRASLSRIPVEGGLFDFLHLVENWENIVGPMLGKNSLPQKINKETLIVVTAHPTFSHDFHYAVPMVLTSLKSQFPQLFSKVSKIKIVQDEELFSRQQKTKRQSLQQKNTTLKKRHPFSPEFQRKKREADEHFKDVEDEEIKKILSDFYIHYT